MKVTKQELKNYNLYDNLPKEFKEFLPGEFFVFYYAVDEKEMKLVVFESTIVKNVNYTLYRGIFEKQRKYNTLEMKVGVFSDTFETRDGLFYQFLRTYNTPEAVQVLYSYAVDEDRVTDLNIETNAITEVYTSEDFRRAISYFSPKRLQTIMFVYDMVNEAFVRRLSKSLYGHFIKKVVNMIKFEGGVLNEIDGSFRYMVIGEKANLTDVQKLRLAEAKQLLRSLHPADKIYSQTGWILGEKDGKWRTNIADNEAQISPIYLKPYDGRMLYVPDGNSVNQILPLLGNPENIYAAGYNGKLGMVLQHPMLYEYYPRLALMPLLYFYGDKGGQNSFYFSENARGGFINIVGDKSYGEDLSIMLHEMQHAIQRIEGFATGGNQFFAQFVISIGSSSVRSIFASINKMQHYFRDELMSNDSRLELQYLIKNNIYRSRAGKQLKDTILEYFTDQTKYEDNYQTINFYLILLIAEEGDFATSEIVEFLQDRIGDIVINLFSNISEAYSKAKYFKEKLTTEDNIKETDLNFILFKGYENLYGEMESRSVQSSRFVQTEYRNYFYLNTWDIAPLQQLTVIDGVEEVVDCTLIKAAVEKNKDEYVLHFNKGGNCEPFLHELGHIVHDALDSLGYTDRLKDDYKKAITYQDYNEWFVNRFIGYLRIKIEDTTILEDTMKSNLIDTSNVVNEILDEFFSDETIGDKLKYLQTILSLV